jgi:hypothetical protein
MARTFPRFSAEDIETLAAALPKPVVPRRLELLPVILDEWSATYLPVQAMIESSAVVSRRMERIARVGNLARELLDALNALDHTDRLEMAVQIIEGEGLSMSSLSHGEFIQRIEDANARPELIEKLALLNPPVVVSKRGQPPKLMEHQILKDAAAIFYWYTGKKPSRTTDGTFYKPAGPFLKFVSTLWPILFSKTGTKGLLPQIKNWVKWTDQLNEGRCSPLILNISWRHPEWRVFEPLPDSTLGKVFEP